jgi:TPR repeat protein
MRVLFLAAALATTASLTAACQDSEVAQAREECQRLASSPDEANNSVGVRVDKIDVEKAYGPCSRIAMSAHATAIDYYRLGRVAYAKKSDMEAVKWFRKAADQDYVLAQYILGVLYANGEGVSKSTSTAVEWYRKAADQGYVNAQFKLGYLYYEGEGVANEQHPKGGDQSLAAAADFLGVISDGEGVAKNASTAAEWFRKAADHGEPGSQYYLGVMYSNGEGVPKNGSIAADWCRKAADHGLADAQYGMGIMYANGEGVPKSISTAAEWFRKAADQDHADALLELGVLEWNGDDYPQDRERGLEHLRRSAALGNAKAKENLKVAAGSDALDAYAKNFGSFGKFLAGVARQHAASGYYDQDASGASQYDRDAAEVNAEKAARQREQDEQKQRNDDNMEQICQVSGEHFNGLTCY